MLSTQWVDFKQNANYTNIKTTLQHYNQLIKSNQHKKELGNLNNRSVSVQLPETFAVPIDSIKGSNTGFNLLTETQQQRLTTIQQLNHNKDVFQALHQDKQAKDKLKVQLQMQKISQVVQRDRERLYLTDRDLATSGTIIKSLNYSARNSDKIKNFANDAILIKAELARLQKEAQSNRHLV